MLRPLDGPSAQTTLSVNSSTVQEVKVGGSALKNRKVVTMVADQRVYVYFGDDLASAPSAGAVAADGIELLKSQLVTFEATDGQPVYILAVSTTANVKVAERA